MTDVTINETGCVVTRSDVTGDILCRAPGADCDCLMTRHDGVYSREDVAAVTDKDRCIGELRKRGFGFTVDTGPDIGAWVRTFIDGELAFHARFSNDGRECGARLDNLDAAAKLQEDRRRLARIAEGYIEAALFTAGVDEQSGEYQVDPEKVEALREYGVAAADAFYGALGDDIALLAMTDRRIGSCIHYEREGHGCGFQDEERATEENPWGTDGELLDIAADTARQLGEDHRLQDELMDRYPEAFADSEAFAD